MNSSDSFILELTRSFIADRYPEEAPFLPLVWERFLRAKGTGTSAHDGTDLSVSGLGLPFADEQRVRLCSPYIVFTLEAVYREMSSRNANPEVANLRDAIRGAAKAFGASRKLVEEMVEDLAPKLHEAFRLDTIGFLAAPSDERAMMRLDQGDVVVDRLHLDRPPIQCVACTPEAADRIAYTTAYDIVVDEQRHIFWVWHEGKAKEIRLRKPSRRLRKLLWLALTRTGKRLTYGDVAQEVGLPVILGDDRLAERIHQYRHRLGNLLGHGVAATGNRPLGENRTDLSGMPPRPPEPISPGSNKLVDRMLTKYGTWEYLVPDVGWSYCWIRANEDRATSLLSV